MEIHDSGNGIKLSGIQDFDLDKIFKCGQCFRWDKDKTGAYTGIAGGRALRLRQDESGIYLSCGIDDFNNIWRSYFDCDNDYGKIRHRISVSDFMRNALMFGKGIRILKQDPWEALCSFIISQNNNIPRIKNIISILCREFGLPVEYNSGILYAFPSADVVAALKEGDLSMLRCGYRAKYIIEAAGAVSSGKINFTALKQSSYDDVYAALKGIPGVGDKVAGCVMLFGLHMLDSFPVDIWIKRALAQHFEPGFDPSVFSPYAGVAQQYIFYYMRNCIN